MRASDYLNHKGKWALCFDELEMAPTWLQSALFSELRCTSPMFVYKLSTAPIPLVDTKTKPTPSNDYTIIRMWSDIKNERKSFCDNIAKTVIKKTIGQTCTPKDLFGSSVVSSNDSESRLNCYEKNSEVSELIKFIASKDDNLHKILVSHGIDVENPYTSDIRKRDQVLRKLKPIVYQKAAFLKWMQEGQLSERSRKTVTEIYSGTEAIYRVSDGNPRRLIGILNELLKHVEYDKNSVPKEITREVQATVIYNASKKFCSFVKGIPECTIQLENRQITLYKQLKKIGKYFFNGLVKNSTTLDPTGSFVIDSLIDDQQITILKIALDQGAIILIDPFSETIESSLRQKRYRLSYMFSPIFKLPLRLYPAINLSTCLGVMRTNAKDKEPVFSQPEFPF